MKIYLNYREGKDQEGQEGLVRIGRVIKRKVKQLFSKPRNREPCLPAGRVYSQVPQGELSITFCDDKYMKKINNRYRHKNESTDVLSFEFGDDKKIVGDIYISIPDALRQAKEYNVPIENELIRLAMHGALHVLGYTHKEMGIYGN
ncbi:rRNA maturation RNase YbeY [Candidatus Saganbacteria bacterium]|nr:rRNA maturation RNase YbeY [Candidatus Saganbacteria bacterium]